MPANSPSTTDNPNADGHTRAQHLQSIVRREPQQGADFVMRAGSPHDLLQVIRDRDGKYVTHKVFCPR